MLVIVPAAPAGSGDDSECQVRCLNGSGRLLNKCLVDGGLPENCERRSAVYFDSCVHHECGIDNETCDDRCAVQTELAVQDCIQSGEMREMCVDRHRTALQSCIADECEIDLLPPPCPVTCQLQAEAALNACLVDNTQWALCARQAQLSANACIQQNCAQAPVCNGQCPEAVHRDGAGDAVFRPTDIFRSTDIDGSEDFDPQGLGPIDLVDIRVGSWIPVDAAADAFWGEFATAGELVRIELTLRGLVNPPGPLGPKTFAPYRYGYKPLYGFIEIDMDNDADTGGEIDAPEFRYLANVARFGGLPNLPRFFDRIATDSSSFLRSFEYPPYLERHGEEFHIAFLGNDISSIEVTDGNTDRVFEAGEEWLIWGHHFHRAHGYEEFSFADGGSTAGEYAPAHPMLFRHDADADLTHISIVFPLTQLGAAGLYDEPLEPINTNPSDQASIFEALSDLQSSAEFLGKFPIGLPEEDIILRWANKNPSQYLDPRHWSITAIVGTSYAALAPGPAYFVWTDVYPNPVMGDVDGSGYRGAHDARLLADTIAEDDLLDGKPDQSAPVPQFAIWMSIFDRNYDGRISGTDIFPSKGDCDNDGDADLADFALLQQCFGNDTLRLICLGNDINRNDRIDEHDAALFRWSMRGPK